MKKFYLLAGLLALLFSLNAQNVATFDDFDLPPDSWWNGSDGSGGFYSDEFWFPNDYNSEWGSWSGFSVSNMRDSVTPGYENQYSAITASGVDSSENYAVVYVSGVLKMEFENPKKLKGFNITNATYPYLSMLNGDDFSKKFGGIDGTDEDYFKLIISGKDIYENETMEIEFFLADFRSENRDSDYIVNTWQWIDLDTLGIVTGLNFRLESTDTGDWGMNTPAYFCMDNFTCLADYPLSSAVSRKRNKIEVYPNPVKNNFFVKLPGGSQELFIADQSGQIIFQKTIGHQQEIRISVLENHPAGIYFINVKRGTEYFSTKVIKN
jgi:hypothetical protein